MRLIGSWTQHWLLYGCAALLVASSQVEARITRIDITAVESPSLAGVSFGDVGQFEKLRGTAYGEVDPRDPLNAIIQDIDLAPRNARGMVEYSTDIYILKPIDMTKGNRMLFYQVGNRGNGGISFNLGVPAGNDPASAGDGFIQAMGYTLIKSGWQADVLPGAGRMTMQVPVPHNPDGSPITGTVRGEYVVGGSLYPGAPTTLNLSSGAMTAIYHASYPTVSTDNKTPLPDGFLPTMTVRSHEKDPRVPVPNTSWAFGSCPDGVNVTPSATQVCMLGAGFQPGKIYELLYRGKDPIVMGLGYAGMRDLISFFKYERHDDAGTANPLWVDDPNSGANTSGTLAIFSGASQSGRNMRNMIHLGFNQDESRRTVFDGAFPLIGGGRAALNIRFAQPGRAWGYVTDHLYPAYQFPFTYGHAHDPLTGEDGGILDRCTSTNTCPKIFHFATSLEVWEGHQSLGLTDPLGQIDFPAPALVRTYLQTSTQHGPAAFPPGYAATAGPCQQQQNPNQYIETQRALWTALTDWVKNGVEPPPSSVPLIRDGTLVRPSEVNFPSIPPNNYGGVTRPAVKWLALANPLSPIDYGPLFNSVDESGIIMVEPPHLGSGEYATLVPQVDADGNDIGGIRSVAVLAPTATYTGWNLYSGVFQDDFCSLSGSYIPFATTREERLATGDPRLSLEERYGNHAGYVKAVKFAAVALVQQRFLLQVDANRIAISAFLSSVLQ